jgi:hypothetical protein
MGSSIIIGSKQISSQELREKQATGALQDFIASKKPEAALEFSTGTVTRSTAAAAVVPQFEPIGIGKPLSIEILTAYSGNAPTRTFFGGLPDVLIVSGVKSVETFKASPKAINQLVPKVKDNQYLEQSAFQQGSSIVYYTPSQTADTVLTSYQMIADSFDQEIFNHLSKLFATAGSLPVFAPQSTYLLAGSFLIQAASKVSHALLESGPFLSSDLTLAFNTPGLPIAQAQNAVLYNDRDQKELEGLELRPKNGILVLVDPQTGDRYQGNAPYFVVGLDGRERTNLKDYSPTLASAAMLEQFYGSGDPAGTAISALGSALELYNDSESRQKALQLQKPLEALRTKIQDLDPSSPDFNTQLAALEKNFANSKMLYDAWAKKIKNPLFAMPEVIAPAPPSS